MTDLSPWSDHGRWSLSKRDYPKRSVFSYFLSISKMGLTCPSFLKKARKWINIMGGSESMKVTKSLSRVWLFETPWTVAHQAPLSMEVSRQEYRSGLPLPSPGNLSHPGIEPECPALQADSLLTEPPGKPHNEWKELCKYIPHSIIFLIANVHLSSGRSFKL